ncbi:MAG: dihydrolipoamide acetyltransferase family protein [Pseudomonadota bacterium]
MGEHLIKLPDVGEGVAEAEIVEWLVDEGAEVKEDDTLASVMTDKATVEIPAPVSGVVVWRGGEIGETIAVGSPLIRIETKDDGSEVSNSDADALSQHDTSGETLDHAKKEFSSPDREGDALQTHSDNASFKVLAAPAVRARAKALGIDLSAIQPTGPEGQVTHADLDASVTLNAKAARTGTMSRDVVEEIPIIGLRRKISENIAMASSKIPHITYVEEVDVTDLEALRTTLNDGRKTLQQKLTLLPFLMKAMAIAIHEQPQFNALYDDDEGILSKHASLHLGVATQTEQGLVVPVIRHVEARSIWDCASEVTRLAEAARTGEIARQDLTGSTITITSLGKLGGIATTPVINRPEVAVIGVNRIRTLPQWDGTAFRPRKMMNLSSSVDHRIIDGWDVAIFIQKIKSLLETPALIFADRT